MVPTSITEAAPRVTQERPRRGCGANAPDGGFVLITVLFVLAFLSLAAATASRAIQTRLALARNAIENAHAEASADSGIALGALRVATPARDRPAFEREPARCRLEDGTTLALAFEDEAGKVDINLAGEELLTALLAGLGLPAGEARARAEAVADYRDADSAARRLGAESEAYAALSLPPPKNAPFDTIAELARVAGFDVALTERLAPYVTVHAGQPGLDIDVADPALVALLARGFDRSAIANPVASAPGTATAPALPDAFRIRSSRRAFTIRSEAETPGGARFIRIAVAGLAADHERGVRPPVQEPRNPDGSLAARVRTGTGTEPNPTPASPVQRVRILAWTQGTARAHGDTARQTPEISRVDQLPPC